MCRTVTADTAHENIHRVDPGEECAFSVADFARRQLGIGMQGQRIIGFRETGIETVRQHRARPGDNFLGGLADQLERATPMIFQRH